MTVHPNHTDRDDSEYEYWLVHVEFEFPPDPDRFTNERIKKYLEDDVTRFAELRNWKEGNDQAIVYLENLTGHGSPANYSWTAITGQGVIGRKAKQLDSPLEAKNPVTEKLEIHIV